MPTWAFSQRWNRMNHNRTTATGNDWIISTVCSQIWPIVLFVFYFLFFSSNLVVQNNLKRIGISFKRWPPFWNPKVPSIFPLSHCNISKSPQKIDKSPDLYRLSSKTRGMIKLFFVSSGSETLGIFGGLCKENSVSWRIRDDKMKMFTIFSYQVILKVFFCLCFLENCTASFLSTLESRLNSRRDTFASLNSTRKRRRGNWPVLIWVTDKLAS